LGTSPLPLSQLGTLVIDDEADQASIDTNANKTDDDGNPIDPTSTNKAIRKLLERLPKCAYVGFTATPFANVLIDKTAEEDLYPRDFIVSLEEPDGYFGSRQLFGLGMAPSVASPEANFAAPLDIIRFVKPEDAAAIAALQPGSECPDLLDRALLDWVLSSGCRLARGQTKQHFSMLIHPSHKTAEHLRVADATRRALKDMVSWAAKPKHFTAFFDRARA